MDGVKASSAALAIAEWLFSARSGAVRDRSVRCCLQDNPESVRKIGIDHATAQCENLLSQGAPGVHFYTLNRSRATLSVLERLNNRSISS